MVHRVDRGAPPVRHVTTRSIVAVRGGSLEVRPDRIVGEAPLEIRAAGPEQEPVAVAVTMRTPGHEAELAVGFLRTEGLIVGPEVVDVEGGDPVTLSQPDDTIVVRLSRPFDDSAVAERHFVATASCGICGKASIDEVAAFMRNLTLTERELVEPSQGPPAVDVEVTFLLGKHLIDDHADPADRMISPDQAVDAHRREHRDLPLRRSTHRSIPPLRLISAADRMLAPL